jgi:glycosyltransferase involved in cell wall biosynthesis
MGIKKNVLFLSHNPHPVHLNFARVVNAKIKKFPCNKLIQLSKIFPFLRILHPIYSFIYSLMINNIREKYVLVDGGSSLYAARFLKFWHKHIKIILLDADLFILKFRGANIFEKLFKKFVLRSVEGIISVSEMNKQAASNLLDIPIKICPPYPGKVKATRARKLNYGLYVGRLDPDKNIKRIVDFGLQCPYLEKFIVVGDGALRNWVIKKSKKNQKLLFFGKKTNVEDYYNKSKFLIHIPDYDPHPVTTMEAAQCGSFPIITKGVGSSYLFDNLFIVDDPNAFVKINERIKLILNNEDMARKKLRKSAAKIPDKDKTLIKFKQIFDKLISELK